MPMSLLTEPVIFHEGIHWRKSFHEEFSCKVFHEEFSQENSSPKENSSLHAVYRIVYIVVGYRGVPLLYYVNRAIVVPMLGALIYSVVSWFVLQFFGQEAAGTAIS